MKRVVKPEILDELAGNDPRAIRSRRDLRLINFLMGNERWLLKQLVNDSESPERVVELGAGTGELTQKIAKVAPVTGLDFQAQPKNLETDWLEGDLFETLPLAQGDVIVANLILHHFQDETLAKLGELLQERRKLIAVEPWRSRLSLAEGALLWPAINDVTRHDMMVSIRAGFQKGELKKALGLGADWYFQEEVSLLGGIRVLAWKQ